MANPQKENGYTPVANEIMEKIASVDLSGRDMRVLMVILRKTYGYQKKSDAISHGQIADSAKMSRRSVIRSVQDLVAKNMLNVQQVTLGNSKLPSVMGFNKNYDEWVVTNISPQTKKNRDKTRKRIAKSRAIEGSDKHDEVVTNNAIASVKHATTLVSNIDKKSGSLSHTKEKRNTKETKEALPRKSEEEIPDPQAALIVEVIHEFSDINPSSGLLYGRLPQRNAAKRLVNKHGLTRVKNAIAFVELNRDDRFCPSITTPCQLEEKWAQLEDYGRKQKSRANGVNNGRGVA